MLRVVLCVLVVCCYVSSMVSVDELNCVSVV